MQTNYIHQSVLLQPAIEALNVRSHQWYIDCTLGSAGHTLEILKKGAYVLGIDQDKEAIARAHRRISQACPALESPAHYILHHGPFSEIIEIANMYGINHVAGILFDLGISSDQLSVPERGFSFLHQGPLDMRMDQSQEQTAAKIVNHAPLRQLEEIFSIYGDEPNAKKIAHAIVEKRKVMQFSTTHELADIVVDVYGGRRKVRGIHPATRIFQALRIAVNRELEQLMAALPHAWQIVEPEGRLVVISFHSGEDRLIKHFFQYHIEKNDAKRITNKPITPTDQELSKNPRARSAKLRIIQKNKYEPA